MITLMCMKCSNVFNSNAKKPVCPECKSYVVKNINDVPRFFGGVRIERLKKEVNELKEYNKSVESVLKILLKRIEKLETMVM